MPKHIQAIRFIAVALLFISSMASKAQTITGSGNRTVTDPSGAIIEGAKVTATSVETNQSSTTVTNNTGVDSIRILQIGHYRVSTEPQSIAPQNFVPITPEAD